MKLGVIDVGSNSLRFFAGENVGNGWINGKKYLWSTRLGQRTKDGALTEESIRATIKALKEILVMAKERQVDRCVAFATSAVREATNRDDFLARVKEECNLSIQVLSGEEEAAFGFAGAASEFTTGGKHCLVIDVGGGSTEVGVGDESGVYWAKSYPIGAVRLKQLSEEGPQRIWEELRGLWEPLPIKGPFSEFVGIGGTFTTLAAMDLELEEYDPELVHGYVLSREKIEAHTMLLRYMTDEERKQVKGLQPGRRAIIVAGCEIVTSFMDAYDVGHIVVSEYDAMEGFELQF